MWLGAQIRFPFVSTQKAGLVLLVAGLLWLWIPVRGKRDLLRRQFDTAMSCLEWDPGHRDEPQCSLDDLLEPSVTALVPVPPQH